MNWNLLKEELSKENYPKKRLTDIDDDPVTNREEIYLKVMC
jgi:hypothetical protein